MSIGDTSTLVVVAMGLFFLVALLVSMLVLGRRQQGREVRELAIAVEELRSGHIRRRPVIDEHSPLAMLSDALQRLGQDLSIRWREAEGANVKLRAVLDGASEIAVVATDPDWDVVGFRGGASSLFGWDEPSIRGESIARLFEEQAWKDLLPRLTRKSLREHGLDTSVTLRRRDGATFPARLAVRTLRSPAGEPTGHLLVIRDRSAQERLETELRASEQRYRGLVEGLREGIFVLRGGQVVYANDALARLCATEADHMRGIPWRDFVASSDVLVVQEVLAGLESAVDARADLHVELRGTGDGAVRRPVRIRAASIRHDGEPAVLGLVQDEVSERRRELELRRGRARLDAVLEGSPDGVLAIDDAAEGGLVCATNAAFLRMFGLTQADVLGRSEGHLVELLGRSRGFGAGLANRMVNETAADGRPAAIADETTGREVEVVIAPLRDRRGRALGRMVMCRDRTELRRSEREIASHVEELERGRRELKQTQERLDALSEDLGRRGEELERLNRELQTLDEMKSEWLGDLSHDLQAPLVSVRGYTEMILKGRLGSINEEQRKGLQVSLKNVDRLISMIDNLLAFSRLTREAGQMQWADVPLHELIDESVAILRERLDSRGIEFSYAGMPPGTLVHGDREMLLRVFTNLLSNAVKFNRDGGRIEVVVRPESSRELRVEVRDTGTGIPQRDLERIFERHYRSVASGAAVAEGSGLGLAIVRDILRLHGCQIRAESVEGRGSVFSFTLPRAGATTRSARPPEDADSQAASPEEAPAGDADPQRPRLRIIRRD